MVLQKMSKLSFASSLEAVFLPRPQEASLRHANTKIWVSCHRATMFQSVQVSVADFHDVDLLSQLPALLRERQPCDGSAA